MIKLLLGVLVVGILLSFLWKQQGLETDPETGKITNEQMDRAADLEVQLQEDLKTRMQKIDKKSD